MQSSCQLQETSRPAVATDWLVDDERHLVAAGVGQQHQMDYARKGTEIQTKIVHTYNTISMTIRTQINEHERMQRLPT